MEKLRFQFAILGAADGKTNVTCITSIETPDGHVFDIPDEFKPINKHKYIENSNTYAKVKNSMKKRGQKRNLWIPIDAEIRKTYLDEGENIQFNNQYLEEKLQLDTNKQEEVTPKIQNIGKITEKFLIEKFSIRMPNASQWMEEFEKECERFEILEDEKKIEALKRLLEKQCLDWHSSMLIKFTAKSNWEIWKKHFCDTYEKKGLSQIKYAFTFKYQAGSLLEYATRKERLLLEINKTIDNDTLINLIVLGLPENIINKLDKESLNSTTDLFSEITKNEHLVKQNEKAFSEYKGNAAAKQDKNKLRIDTEKKYKYSICEKLKKGPRYHPESTCWFRPKENQANKSNQIRLVNNSELECELQNEDQKN